MIFLDTNAYTALAKGQDEIIALIQAEAALALPLPVIAELKYGFLKGSQASKNEENLQRFLAHPRIEVLLPTIHTTLLYAKLQLACVKAGKSLSHNDLWIAAITKENGGSLVTYDRDFKALAEIFSDRLIIL